MAYETIKVDIRGRVGLVTLDRPTALNALNTTLLAELLDALRLLGLDDAIGAAAPLDVPRYELHRLPPARVSGSPRA